MNTPLLVANWKMNVSPAEATELAKAVVQHCKSKAPRVRLLLAPSFESLSSVGVIIKNSRSIGLCAQDCADHLSGAYTGEVSAVSLKAIGCTHVIVGHSERRGFYHDTIQIVATKLARADNAGLTPIMCIGETAAERKRGNTAMALSRQLRSVLRCKNALVAYEPIWAIGSGIPMASIDFSNALAHIKKELRSLGNPDALVLYGGSVAADTIAAFVSQCDGVLVGSASQSAESLISLLDAV